MLFHCPRVLRHIFGSMPVFSFKDSLVRVLGAPGISRMVASGARESVVIIMMHRFAASSGGYAGHSPSALKRSLSEVRRAGIEMVDVENALEAFVEGEGRERSRMRRRPRVAFTIDDGYADALEVAGPVFAEFDCPVTSFVAPDIVDAKEWYWWDKIDTLIQSSPRHELVIDSDGAPVTLSLRTPNARAEAYGTVCELIRRLPFDAVPAFLAEFADAADTELPSAPPPRYRVLDWRTMRSAEQRGWRFGAHSMTHPLMGRCTDARAEWEIGESIAAVRARLTNPSGVFCYPVGREGDFGAREFEILRRHGVRWALSAIPGRLRSGQMALTDPAWQWRIPRFAHDERRGGILRMFLS